MLRSEKHWRWSLLAENIRFFPTDQTWQTELKMFNILIINYLMFFFHSRRPHPNFLTVNLKMMIFTPKQLVPHVECQGYRNFGEFWWQVLGDRFSLPGVFLRQRHRSLDVLFILKGIFYFQGDISMSSKQPGSDSSNFVHPNYWAKILWCQVTLNHNWLLRFFGIIFLSRCNFLVGFPVLLLPEGNIYNEMRIIAHTIHVWYIYIELFF